METKMKFKTPPLVSLLSTVLGVMVGNGVYAQDNPNTAQIVNDLNHSRLVSHSDGPVTAPAPGPSGVGPDTYQAPVNVPAPPNRFLPKSRLTKQQVEESLGQQRIDAKEVFKNLDSGDPHAPVFIPTTDLRYYNGWTNPSPPSSEGIPAVPLVGRFSPTATAEEINNYRAAFSTAQYLEKTLRDCGEQYDYGPRIACYENMISNALVISAHRPDEKVARFVLNRAVDTVHHILPSAGAQVEAMAITIDQLYKNRITDAIGYINNTKKFIWRFADRDEQYSQDVNVPDPAAYLLTVSVAEFGRQQFDSMYRISENTQLSVSAQAIALMRGLGYFGWDLTSDLRWRERPIRQLILAVVEAQESPAYNQILATLAAGHEPKPSDLDTLQQICNDIRKDAIPKLREAGVASMDPDPSGAPARKVDR